METSFHYGVLSCFQFPFSSLFVSWLQFKGPFGISATRIPLLFLSDVKGDNWAKQKIQKRRKRRTFISVSVYPTLASIKRAKWSAITIMFVILPAS